jgi:Rrf2 family protein
MKLSTRSRYGLRLMYELAVNYGGDIVIIKDIALRQNISGKYLSRLVIPLKGAKLVTAARGAHGGYRLARDPSEITLWEIIELLEGDITPVECVRNSKVCARSKKCPTRDVWCRLDRLMVEFLESITLKDLAMKGDVSSLDPSFCAK